MAGVGEKEENGGKRAKGEGKSQEERREESEG